LESLDDFPTVWRRYYKPLLYFVRGRLRGHSHLEAEDVVQDIMVKVYRARRGFDPSKSLRTWLYTIARNHCIDLARKRRFDRQLGRIDEGLGRGPTEVGALRGDEPETEVLARDARAHVRSALDALAAEDREIMFLRYFEDLTYEQVAAIVGRPAGTVKYRVHELKRCLRRRLEGAV
jgi:RNA polymerase sigma-70 factor (ECF subfamily)